MPERSGKRLLIASPALPEILSGTTVAPTQLEIPLVCPPSLLRIFQVIRVQIAQDEVHIAVGGIHLQCLEVRPLGLRVHPFPLQDKAEGEVGIRVFRRILNSMQRGDQRTIEIRHHFEENEGFQHIGIPVGRIIGQRLVQEIECLARRFLILQAHHGLPV